MRNEGADTAERSDAGLRQLNQAKTLRALHDGRSLTVADLVTATGLSRRTIEVIVDGFVAREMVFEQGPKPSHKSVGRPARRFVFNPGTSNALAIYIAYDFIEVGVCDLYGTPLGNWSFETDPANSRAERLDAVRTAIGSVFLGLGIPRSRIGAVTIATMGVVNDDGTIDLWQRGGHSEVKFPDWSGFNLASELASEFVCEVQVESIAKLAAYGEMSHGAAKECRDFLSLIVGGQRVALGIVLGGKVYRGKNGNAGEILWAEQALGLGIGLSDFPLSYLGQSHTAEGQEAVAILAAARRGEKAALKQVGNLAQAMAPGLLALSWIFAPEVLVIGGALGAAGDVLLPEIRAHMSAPLPRGVELRASSLGSKAVVLGALRNSLNMIEESLFFGAALNGGAG